MDFIKKLYPIFILLIIYTVVYAVYDYRLKSYDDNGIHDLSESGDSAKFSITKNIIDNTFFKIKSDMIAKPTADQTTISDTVTAKYFNPQPSETKSIQIESNQIESVKTEPYNDYSGKVITDTVTGRYPNTVVSDNDIILDTEPKTNTLISYLDFLSAESSVMNPHKPPLRKVNIVKLSNNKTVSEQKPVIKSDLILVSADSIVQTRTNISHRENKTPKDLLSISVTVAEDSNNRCQSPISLLAKYSDDIHIKVLSVADKLYAIDKRFNVLKFSSSTCSWDQMYDSKTSRPSARTEASINVIGDKVYIFGGWGYGSVYFSDIWYYDTKANLWIEERTNKDIEPRAYHSATVVDSQIYIYGGYNGVFLDDLWIFDSKSHSWRSIKSEYTPPASGYHKAVYSGNNIYIIDGYDKFSNIIQDIWVFSLADYEWRLITVDNDDDKYALIYNDASDSYEDSRDKLNHMANSNRYIDRYGRGYSKPNSSQVFKVSEPKIIFESSGNVEFNIENRYEYNINSDTVYEKVSGIGYDIAKDIDEKKVAWVDYNIDVFYTRPDMSIKNR